MKNYQRNRKSILNPKACRYTALLFAGVMLLVSIGHISAEKLLFLTSLGGARVAVDHQMRVFPPLPEEELLLIIVYPHPDQAFSFDAGSPGELRIERAVALVLPEEYAIEYADEIEWSIDDIGGTQAEITPDRGPVVDMVFRGLPDQNDDFGEKRITAAVRGVSDSVTVRAFFDPQAQNHPGGDSEPNWFYYWKQIDSIIGDRDRSRLRYEAGLQGEGGALVTGQYRFPPDIVILSDAILSASCAQRMIPTRPGPGPHTYVPTGVNATGIDCFAESVWHEWQHREDMFNWWGSRLNYAVKRNLWEDYEDKDNDDVPRHYEEAVGWSDNFPRCSPSRPYPIVKDNESYSYWTGWLWQISAADHQDWSRDGKQWPSGQ